MLINFLNQNYKNYMFHEPDVQKALDVKGKVDKPSDTGKPDYADQKSRESLYKKVETAIKKLNDSHDKNNSAAATDLQNNLNGAKKNESMHMLTPEEVANDLHDKLTAIPKSAAEAKLSAQLTAMAKTSILPEDTINPRTSPKTRTAKAAALQEAGDFGMIGLLKAKKGEEAPKEKPAIVLSAAIITGPKPDFMFVKTSENPPLPVKNKLANFIAGDSAFSGEKYVKTNDGNIWEAQVKLGKNDQQSSIQWKKAVIEIKVNA